MKNTLFIMIRSLTFRFFLGKTLMVIGLILLGSCNKPTPPTQKNEILKPLDYHFSLLHRMQGRWIDQRNDEAILEVNGTSLISEFQGEVMRKQEIIVVKDFPNNCNGQPNKDGLGFFITQTDDGPFCYQVIELSEKGIRYEAVGLLE